MLSISIVAYMKIDIVVNFGLLLTAFQATCPLETQLNLHLGNLCKKTNTYLISLQLDFNFKKSRKSQILCFGTKWRIVLPNLSFLQTLNWAGISLRPFRKIYVVKSRNLLQTWLCPVVLVFLILLFLLSICSISDDFPINVLFQMN